MVLGVQRRVSIVIPQSDNKPLATCGTLQDTLRSHPDTANTNNTVKATTGGWHHSRSNGRPLFISSVKHLGARTPRVGSTHAWPPPGTVWILTGLECAPCAVHNVHPHPMTGNPSLLWRLDTLAVGSTQILENLPGIPIWRTQVGFFCIRLENLMFGLFTAFGFFFHILGPENLKKIVFTIWKIRDFQRNFLELC